MSTLYIYPNCKITRDRNCLVDNIQAYLQSQRYLPSIEIQYQQIELNKRLKLNMSQSVVGESPFNYLEIIQDNKSFYYFIDKVNWKSTETVEFELTLDTVNTFASDFSFDKKTRILRQHKDRLEGRDKVEQNWDVWEYVPANKDIVLNPWAWENEVADTFYVRWGRGDIECSITKYHDGKAYITYNDVISIEQAYVGQGQRAVAMTFAYYDGDTLKSVVLEYDDLMSDFNNSTYWVIKFVGNVSDLVYSPNDHWQSLFWGYYNRYFMRKIDQVEEGLNPPQFKYNTDSIIHSTDDIPWNLVYIAQNNYDPDNPEAFLDNNPLQCSLYPSESLSIEAVNSSGTELDSGDFENGKSYFFVPPHVVPPQVQESTIANYYFGLADAFWRGDYKIVLSNTSSTRTLVVEESVWHYTGGGTTERWTLLDKIPSWVVVKKDDNVVYVDECSYPYTSVDSGVIKTKHYTIEAANFRLRFITSQQKVFYVAGTVNPTLNSANTYWRQVKSNTENGWFALSGSDLFYLRPIPESLKADSRVMKIIQVPYCPLYNYDENNHHYYDINGWTWDSNTYSLKKVNIEANINNIIKLQWNPLDLLKLDYVEPGSNDYRDDKYESKTKHSEFYVPKLVYDSFSYTYRLENVNTSNAVNLEKAKEIDYKVSNTFSGNFLFGMNVPLKRSISDYDNIMIVNRNNELPVYTSAFMNYVRNGYNWDVKNKNLQIGKSLATTGISTAGGLLGGLAMGAMGGSSAGPIGAAVGAAVGLAGGLINLAFNQAQADNNIKQKIEESNRQGVSVNDCDDINLLAYYTDGNKAKQVEYQASTKFIDIIRDLFYYFGYKEDIRNIPNLNSRLWFNYIQCEPVFKENYNWVYKNYLDDIKQRYQEGVTVYHRVNDTYDWDQVKENWETSLL